jgi:fructose-bisphosphate aldolase class I
MNQASKSRNLPHSLGDVARTLFADNKGILAMDESTRTCDRRFSKAGIPQTVETRREYRELLLTAPGLAESISGVILFDETIRQKTKEGKTFLDVISQAGIVPGIKVDQGTIDLDGSPGEMVTIGLDGLSQRLDEYVQMGARFAKWRCMLILDEDLPTQEAILANVYTLARYAALCQEAGILPIVEPEVVMKGSTSIERCASVTTEVLRMVVEELKTQNVDFEDMILKPNMILPGLTSQVQVTEEDVADATIKCLLKTIPAEVPGIAFLSGGQPGERDSAFLNAMNAKYRTKVPWALSFSFGRAIQYPALEIWSGNANNREAAQRSLVHRAKCNRVARRGEYNVTVESNK